MDIYLKTENVDQAARSVDALITQLNDSQATLQRARELVLDGSWTGSSANLFIERFNTDMMWLQTYLALLSQFRGELDNTVQQMNDTDQYLRQSMPG
jgi:uncharacterized protein YukE